MTAIFCLKNLSIKPLTAVLWVSLVFAIAAQAQSDNKPNDSSKEAEQQAAARLNELHISLLTKRQQISELKQQLKSATGEQQQILQQQLDALSKELTGLQQTFEQIATNGVDLEVFIDQPEQFDWSKELVQVTRPLLENLKSLTEKPRKIERLRSEIEQGLKQLAATEKAQLALLALQDETLSVEAKEYLTTLIKQWQQRQTDIKQQLEVSRYQLANLSGQNTSWWETITTTLNDFLHNRGLTLALAVIVGALVWLLLRGLRWLHGKRFAGNQPRQRSVRRRLIFYSYRLLTTLLVITAVLAVFYVRGDLLLLALSMLVLGFLLLNSRQTLPRYGKEIKLLLNIGPVREDERLIYNGLPWQVKSINLYSVLRNPDLEGVIRLPLAALTTMHSRPCGDEPWFPSRVGDFILLANEPIAEVIRQTPELVQLKIMGGSIKEYPAAQFTQLAFRNLSRGGTFAVPIIFGIDYRHQAICLNEVPQVFQQAVKEAMHNAGFGDAMDNILVDFKAAAASSLDYLIAVTMKSTVAASYIKIERLLQQTCVEVCNRENWNIPFAQLTVHSGEA